MQCPSCKVDMVLGVAIEPKLKYASIKVKDADEVLNVSELKMIDVEKCPKCGHVEEYCR